MSFQCHFFYKSYSLVPLQLLLEGPPPTPTALTEAGIFAPPIAVPRAAVMAEVPHVDADPNANELAEAGASE